MSYCLRALGATGVDFQQGEKWDVGQEESTSTVREGDDSKSASHTSAFSNVLLLNYVEIH